MPVAAVSATRYVAPLREGGSLPALVEASDDGLYVVKLRGSGQGPKTLVAELIAAELARALELPVPDPAIVTIPAELAKAEPDPEIQELLAASTGENAGLDFLPGSLAFSAGSEVGVASDLAARIVWFDALIENVDRTPRNPNLLFWHGELKLIDHGAAFYRQHRAPLAELDPAAPFKLIADHVLLDRAGPIGDVDELLAARLAEDVVSAAIETVPADWFGESGPGDYARFLGERLAARDGWVGAIEAAKGAGSDG